MLPAAMSLNVLQCLGHLRDTIVVVPEHQQPPSSVMASSMLRTHSRTDTLAAPISLQCHSQQQTHNLAYLPPDAPPPATEPRSQHTDSLTGTLFSQHCTLSTNSGTLVK